MKNQILLENYYLSGQLGARLAEFVAYYNTRRHHESLRNLTPADVSFGRGQATFTRRPSNCDDNCITRRWPERQPGGLIKREFPI
jgi:putative transposase